MLYADDFRRIARDGLYGRWGTAVGTGFVANLFGASYFSNRTIIERVFTRSDENPSIRITVGNIGTITRSPILGIIILVLVWGIVCMIVGGAVSLGYAKFNLNMVAKDRKDIYYSDLFSQFHRIGAGFCMRFLINLYIFLWTLLFIIPGIIASYSYSMTHYIMVENPEYGVNEAIAASKEMMRGNRWRLFCLRFSFIGWSILCIFTLGIGYLWLNPYMEAANAAFYKEISGWSQK